MTALTRAHRWILALRPLMLPLLVAGPLAGLVSPAAQAQSAPVYRCGDTYQQAPCDQGRVVNTADPRDPQQQKDAAAALAKDRQTAEQLRQERLARDKASPPPAGPTGIKPSEPPAAKAGDTALPECKEPASHRKKGGHAPKARKDCKPLPTYTSPKPAAKPAEKKSDKKAN